MRYAITTQAETETPHEHEQNARHLLARRTAPIIEQAPNEKARKPRISRVFLKEGRAAESLLSDIMRENLRKVQAVNIYEDRIQEEKEFKKNKRQLFAQEKQRAILAVMEDFKRREIRLKDAAIQSAAALKEAKELKPAVDAAMESRLENVKAELHIIWNMPSVRDVSLRYQARNAPFGMRIDIDTNNIQTAKIIQVRSRMVSVPQVLLPRLHITMTSEGAFVGVCDTQSVSYMIPFTRQSLYQSQQRLCLGESQASYMHAWRRGQYALCFATILQVLRGHMNASAGYEKLYNILPWNGDVVPNEYVPQHGDTCTIECPAMWGTDDNYPVEPTEGRVDSYDEEDGSVFVSFLPVEGCSHDCAESGCDEEECEHDCASSCMIGTRVYNAPEFITFRK